MDTEKNTKTKKILLENDNIDIEIRRMNNKIQMLKDSKKINYQKLWNACEHNWVYDTSSSFDDLVKYHCQKCNLYRRKDFYF